MQGLRLASGIRYTVYAGTKRHDRAVFQEFERRMRLVERLFVFLRKRGKL